MIKNEDVAEYCFVEKYEYCTSKFHRRFAVVAHRAIRQMPGVRAQVWGQTKVAKWSLEIICLYNERTTAVTHVQSFLKIYSVLKALFGLPRLITDIVFKAILDLFNTF